MRHLIWTTLTLLTFVTCADPCSATIPWWDQPALSDPDFPDFGDPEHPKDARFRARESGGQQVGDPHEPDRSLRRRIGDPKYPEIGDPTEPHYSLRHRAGGDPETPEGKLRGPKPVASSFGGLAWIKRLAWESDD
jgi:hypothetical protein